MFEALSGKAPFNGTNTVEIMQQHLKTPPPSVTQFARQAGIDRGLAALILSGLSKDPAARPASAKTFYDNLLSTCSQVKSADLESSRAESTMKFPRSSFFKYGNILFLLMLFVMTFAKVPSIQSHSGSQTHNKLSADAGSLRAGLAEKERESYLHDLASAEKLHGKNSLQLLPTLHLLANNYYKVGNYAQEVNCLDRALKIRQMVLAPTDLHIADSLLNLARARHCLKKPSQCD
jgi:serine/threonine protein kinase